MRRATRSVCKLSSAIRTIRGSSTSSATISSAPTSRSAICCNQAVGYLTGLLASVWEKGQALISIFSLLIITPVVAFYLICDWDRMVDTLDRLIPLPQRETVRSLVPGDRRDDLGLCARPVRRVPDPRLLLCRRLDAGGLELRPADRRRVRADQLHSLCRLADRARALARVAVAQFFPDWSGILIVAGIVLVGQFLEGNVLSPNLVGHSVGLHPVWLMFALVRVRLSVRLRRAAARRAARGGSGRADPICGAALSWQSRSIPETDRPRRTPYHRLCRRSCLR